jgi:hypothetical protein
VDVADAPAAFVLASTRSLFLILRTLRCVVARDGNVFAGKLNDVPGRKCANSRTLVSARLRRFAGDGSRAFTVVRGRSPSAIECVVEVSGDCHGNTISYDQHDQLMKARLDS